MFRYRYDTETGLYYLQSRYYNPDWGRFINADGIAATSGELLSANMFAYCKNNPVSMSDADGYRPEFSGTGHDTGEDNAVSLAIMNGRYDYNTGIIRSSLPKQGEPNSKKRLYNPDGSVKQEREYGSDGLPKRDTDYNHGGVGHVFPHTHEWKDGVRQGSVPVVPKLRNDSSVILGTGATIGTGYVIYRVVRMLPSLLPPFWWTIPANALEPF